MIADRMPPIAGSPTDGIDTISDVITA